jgi:hypothetical protein
MHKLTTVALSALVIGNLCGLAYFVKPSTKSAPGPRPQDAPAPLPANPLEFRELFAQTTALKPSTKVQALAEKRVRMQGFMAQMELPPLGGFYLTPRQVVCDEAGAGTADLPLESVFVVASSARDHEVPFVAGPLVVRGVLEVGNRADAQGRVSAFRIRLDPPSAVEIATNTSPSGKTVQHNEGVPP